MAQGWGATHDRLDDGYPRPVKAQRRVARHMMVFHVSDRPIVKSWIAGDR
jgi:hypothetical protein